MINLQKYINISTKKNPTKYTLASKKIMFQEKNTYFQIICFKSFLNLTNRRTIAELKALYKLNIQLN